MSARTRSGAGGLLRRLLFLLDGLVLTCFLTGYAAAWIRPDPFWPAAVLGTLFPYLALLLLAATVAVVPARRRGLLLLHLALLLLAAVRFLPPGPPARAAGGGRVLEVMSFNVRGHFGEEISDGRLNLETAAAVGPDLLALQEFSIAHRRVPRGRSRQRRDGARVDSLAYVPPRLAVVVDPWMVRGPVLSRLPAGPYTQVELEHAPGEHATSYVSRTPFRWEGREAALYNIHLRSFGADRPWSAGGNVLSLSDWRRFLESLGRAYRVRAREAEQVRRLLARERLPVIVCGDFNATVHNWEYRRIARGLRNAFTVGGKGWGATYHRDLPLFRIDHVLAGPEWDVVEAELPAGGFASDHRPLVARLRWRVRAD